MLGNKLDPEQGLNKALLKVNPQREKFEVFKANLRRLIEQVDEGESEAFHTNLLSDFLKETYYSPQYFINTKGRNDLVIHTGKTAKTAVGVMIEAKRPSNLGEMPKVDNLNVKALQELVLYFLRERITGKNIEIKHLVITNVYEWFIFDAKLFDRLFAQDRDLARKFNEFEQKQLSGDKTDFFYQQIAKPAITANLDKIQFTHVDLRDYATALREDNPAGEKALITLYKLLSPEHLLKLPFANDSNRLNKPFYNELLYIIGLAETKQKGKKVIGRVKDCDRQGGSLIENAMSRLDSLGKISRLSQPEAFGETEADRLFNVALRLSINWINRILFLKLLEAQLIKYHQGDRQFAFLNLQKVKSYDDLESLFFDVLAREPDKREARVKEIFAHVPYLNSSLFEPTETEQETIVISNLQDRNLPIFSATVLKDADGKRRSGELNALQYLFEFLDAYDFSSDESEDDREDSEKLINAAVLGLIFEKINGYKDGSFYTPSFITMYMCRETIRRAIVQKFNEVKGWNCKDLEDLYEKIEDKLEANQIINRLKICDPAVGSGHFLVSALNEIIAIKSELRVLLDRSGKSLKDYRVEVKNDKLLVYDDEGNLFAYRPNNAEKQRVQEALFHEKQTLIEGCLFGVDINPNSVKICQLRLWIELLKNAYYKSPQPPFKSGASLGDLETLPNIDINIKCGNSLISRFPLDLKVASGKSQSMIERYRQAVRDYQQAKDKGQKREIERLINEIKGSFRTTLTGQDPNKTRLRNLEGELYQLENQGLLFEESAKEKKAREKKVTKLSNEIDKLRAEIADIESGRLYDQALEWRFEFPEVLNDQGDFVGFDVVIGNPPYIRQEEIKELKPNLQQNYQCYTGVADLFVYFYELGLNLLKTNGYLTYISSNKYFRAGYGEKIRQFLTDSTTIHNLIDFGDYPVFEEAIAYPSIITLSKTKSDNNQIQALSWDKIQEKNIATFATVLEENGLSIVQENLKPDGWRLESAEVLALLAKLRSAGTPLGEYANGKLYRGIVTGLNEAFVVDRATRDQLIAEHTSSSELLKPFLRGRDVRKWMVDYSDLWLIFTRKGTKINNYPAIKNHLLKYKAELSKRLNVVRDGDEWFQIPYAINYWQEFEQPKIIIPAITNNVEYTVDSLGYYGNDKTSICILENPYYVLAILNSSLMWWFIRQTAASRQGGFFEFKPAYVSQIPIINATKKRHTAIEKLVQKCLDMKKDDPKADTSQLETEIDHLVYKLYQLTYEEVKIIDPDFPLTPQQYANLKIE